VHHARETLRREGYRLTPQRTLIWEVVRGCGRHMTAEEIAVEVHEKFPEVNLSTVYRTLELLVGLDLVGETRLGTSRTYYEVAPEPVHHHFVCESCGAVGHIADDLLDPLYGSLRDEQGFQATSSRTTVFGLCKGCQDATAPAQAAGDAHT
jgi:Fur family ferric uptake transcriptional regulator